MRYVAVIIGCSKANSEQETLRQIIEDGFNLELKKYDPKNLYKRVLENDKVKNAIDILISEGYAIEIYNIDDLE